jgi:delta-aminolevulinic acid dehydratase/porphobilinogen synthase
MSGESLEALNSIGIISVLLIPVLSYREKATAGARAQNLRDIGTVSEEAIKGDVRSHMIRYACTTCFIQISTDGSQTRTR